MKKTRPAFTSEAHLCAAFIESLPLGWIPYPETAGWDVLVVVPGGDQIGIQAKLRANIAVLAQALPARPERVGSTRGPLFRAVLVPYADAAFSSVAVAAGIGVLHALRDGRFPHAIQQWGWPTLAETIASWRLWEHRGPCELPPVVPTGPAGVPSPSPLTPWRVGALRICTILRARGYVTRTDFAAAGNNASTWVARGWLRADGKEGRLTRYVAAQERDRLRDLVLRPAQKTCAVETSATWPVALVALMIGVSVGLGVAALDLN